MGRRSCPGEREVERSQQVHTIVNRSHRNRHMGEGVVEEKNLYKPMDLCAKVSLWVRSVVMGRVLVCMILWYQMHYSQYVSQKPPHGWGSLQTKSWTCVHVWARRGGCWCSWYSAVRYTKVNRSSRRNHHMVEGKTKVSTSLLSLHCPRSPELLVYEVYNF
jgi:hypothetical protein